MCRHLGHFIKECVFPDNKPEDIAREVVYAITHEKEEIILPVFFTVFCGNSQRLVGLLLPFISLFPRVITDYVFAFMGGGHGMDGFKGRGKEWNRSWRLEKHEKEEQEEGMEENTVVFCNVK